MNFAVRVCNNCRTSRALPDSADAFIGDYFANLIAIVLATCIIACAGCGKGFQLEDGRPAIVGWAGGRTVQYLNDADPDTFKALPSSEDALAIYATDAKKVYIGINSRAMSISHADPSEFSILTADGTYAADKDRVYWFGVEIPGANPSTFKLLEAPYGIDDERAYAGITPFDVHSVSDFEVVSVFLFGRPVTSQIQGLVVDDPSDAYVSGWCRDGFAYYWGAVELEGADYDAIKILNQNHAKDGSRVYYRGNLVRGADAATFTTIGPGMIRGKDKNYHYEQGKRTKPVEKVAP